MRVNIITLGCKVNSYESEILKRELALYGYQIDPENPELVIINSCSVTKQSDTKSAKEIRRALEIGASVVLMGCHAPTEELKQKVLYIPNEDKHFALSLILQNFGSTNHQAAYKPTYTRSFLKVQDGCNNFCSYCIIPYLRGREQSYPLEQILSEVEKEVSLGFKEFVLSGINLSHYGKGTGSSLIELIEAIAEIKGVKRLRLGSLEQSVVTDDFLARLKAIESFCPQFHLSLQSGSAAVLNRMNRHYSPEEYQQTVERIRRYFPLAAITTDIIVGFPGETEAEFQETVSFVERIRFARVHIFPYSKRQGTKAALMKDYPTELKKQRLSELRQLTERLEDEYISSFLGKPVEVLFETKEGHTREYLSVLSETPYQENDIVTAIVKRKEADHLWI